MSTATIQADFDRIALVSGDGWDHNSHYHRFLLEQLPSRCHSALDVGCGTGAFSRLLATRCDQVLAIDLSPQMIQIARDRSAEYNNLTFQVADVMSWHPTPEPFDCIVSIATLHHLAMDDVLAKLKAMLKAGGMLVILDLYGATGVLSLLTGAVAMPLSMVLRLLKTGRLRPPLQARLAWAEHGRHDLYLTWPQIRQAYATALPEARIRRHLLWRYSAVWHKPRD